MKSIILSLLLLAVSSPAIALTKEEAVAAGDRKGDATCKAVWSGARSLSEVVMTEDLSRSDRDIMNFINQLGDKKGESHPLVKAYRAASIKSSMNCRDELLRLISPNSN